MTMLAPIRKQLTFANIAAGLALVVALGSGGAYAAGLAKNSVGSKQIVNGSITGKDVKKDALTGDQVKDGSLTGADVNAATLGTVTKATSAGSAADAGALGGIVAASYGRSVAHAKGSFTTASPFTVSVPGFGQVGFECEAGNKMTPFASLNAPAGATDILKASYSDGPLSDATTILYNPGDANTTFTTLSNYHVEITYYLQGAGGAKAFVVYGYAYNDFPHPGCNAVLEVQQLRG